ncbi:hypothetical protein ACXX82_24215 [Glaciimonas sp. GNP009]
MELVTVNITGQAITARYGTLNSGDVLRTDAEFARHLVVDCCAAEYENAKNNTTATLPLLSDERIKESKPKKIK